MGQSSPGSLQGQAPDKEDGQDDVGEERREVDDLAGGLQERKCINDLNVLLQHPSKSLASNEGDIYIENTIDCEPMQID